MSIEIQMSNGETTLVIGHGATAQRFTCEPGLLLSFGESWTWAPTREWKHDVDVDERLLVLTRMGGEHDGAEARIDLHSVRVTEIAATDDDAWTIHRWEAPCAA